MGGSFNDGGVGHGDGQREDELAGVQGMIVLWEPGGAILCRRKSVPRLHLA